MPEAVLHADGRSGGGFRALPLAAEHDLAVIIIKLGPDLLIGPASGVRIVSETRSRAEPLKEHGTEGRLLKGRSFGAGIFVASSNAAMPEAVLRAD